MNIAVIAFRVFDTATFMAFADHPDDSPADILVHAMLSGKPPLDCGYELIRIEHSS